MNLIWMVFFALTQQWLMHVVIADFAQPQSSFIEGPEDEHLDLMPINSRDFRSNITKDISEKPWHDDRQERYIIRCVRPTKCERIQTNTCFGGKIPYKFTSVELSEEGSQEHIVKKLKQLETLKNVPKCWAVLQPFLCAVYLPKCTRSNDKEYVYLPSYEMCRVTAEPCRILYDTDFFPNYLKCNEKVFPCRNCSNDVRDMKFTTISSQCMSPLVATDSVINYYPDMEGCGLQCKDPMYTDEEHESMQALIFWGSILCIVCNIFVIATFKIHDWKHSSAKHPACNLLQISVCFLFNWIGWMLQFIPGHRENIVCRRDGTLRYSEPSAGDNLACLIPFMLIYYSLIAANVWFAIFTYAWFLQTKDRGSIRDRIDKESFYFNFIAWALPLILMVPIVVLSEVDGNSITGICFVGYRNRAIRNGLVLVPVAILTFGVSVFFSFKGGFNLNSIKRTTSSDDESQKLNSHILSMGIRTMLVVFFTFAFFIFETYELRNEGIWTKSLNDLIICKIKESYSGDSAKCKLQNRPSVAVLQLRLLCLFCVNLVISSWCWTWPALKTWKRFIKKKIGYELSEDEKCTKQKHRIIADAYAKRMDDVISVSIENPHTDPAGINFDVNNLNPAESGGMSPTLTNYLCNLINRRNAVTTLEQSVNCAPYASSCADNNSEFSVSVRHVEVASRRSSIDSQVSIVTMSEIKATLDTTQKQCVNACKMKVQTKKRQHHFYTKQTSRRASSSSMESQAITNQMINNKYKKNSNNRIQVGRQIERRSAISTTPADLKDFKQFLNRHHFKHTTTDDDQSIDDTQPVHDTNDPSNMLVPLGMPEYRVNDRRENLNASNDKHASIEQRVMSIIQNSMGEELENFLRNSYNQGSNGMGKGDRNSMKSGRNQRHSHTKLYPSSKNDEHLPSKIKRDRMNDIATSMSSSIDSDIVQHLNGTQSSFSDQSSNRRKTQSQNSKGSCDVGIQANDYDISSHTRQHSRDDCDKDNFSEKLRTPYNQQDNDCTEMHQLLPIRLRDQPTIVQKNAIGSKHLSGAEKAKELRKLLMP